jgi:transposase
VIQLTPHMKILVALEPQDFRRGIDGLSRVCREELDSDPFTGTIFVFRNRRSSIIRFLVYDGQGFWLATKRLSVGRFRWWPKGNGDRAVKLGAHELQVLLYNGDPSETRAAPAWREVSQRA